MGTEDAPDHADRLTMAKGRSSITQKAIYQAKQAYTPRQRMAYESCECDPKGAPIGADDDFKITGGFDPKKVCPTHHIALSVNGSCIECPE